MTDLESYKKAIKGNWVTKLLTIDGIWKQEILNKIGVDMEYFLKCNIRYKDIPNQLKKNSMWKEIWEIWSGENSREVNTIEDILNQNLWYNSSIKINKKTIFRKEWYSANFKWIADMIVVTDSNDEMKDMGIKKLTQMDYNSIVSAIPRKRRKTIKTTVHLEEDMEDNILINKLLESKKPMRILYKKIVKEKVTLPENSLDKWNRDLNSDTNN
jgi:hypothetical protein